MKIARINTALLVAIVIINGYIIVLPVVPGLLFWWHMRDGKQSAQLGRTMDTITSEDNRTERPAENRLIVPGMAFNQPVFEGKTARTLNSGLWHRPQSSSPDKGGNTVFVGHRLTYTNPRGTLYHLDKIHAGDEIGIWCNDRAYRYRVTEVTVVRSTETNIEAPTKDARLTIYTCTPLWLPKDRLVVVAQLEDTPHD
ncbi:MAG: sortase [Patescibacteria group bacterium]